MALNKKLASAVLLGLGTALAGAAHADISITIGSNTGAVGGTANITYDYAALDADDVGGFQFDILYDNVALTPMDITNCGVNLPATHVASCTEPGGAGSGTIRVLLADFSPPTNEVMPFNIPMAGNITFTVNQPGTHALTFSNGVGSDLVGGNVAIAGTDGAITAAITGNAGYSSAPAPGSTIALGMSPVGTPTAAQNITVSEIGDMPLDVTAIAFTGANAGDFASGTAPFMIADGGASVDVDVACTPGARGMRTGTVELTNNSVNDPTPQYTLTCAGTSPNVAVSTAAINLSGVIGGANPTGNFDITNVQDGFTIDATNAALVESGTAEISVTAGLADPTISVGETDNVTVSCDATNAGNFNETITLNFDDPAAPGGTGSIDVAVTCAIANAFPVYESVPTPGSTIDFGGVINGGTSAPLGVDVGNSGAVGGAALNVTAASITGADAAQFNLTFAPFSVPALQGPDGTNDITVTCSPNAAAAFTATLVVNTDDPSEPAGGFTYPLACAGTVDAQFSSTPAPGSNISFGVVLPGSSVDSVINMANGAGANDDLTIDCALTADPEITLVSPVFPVTVVAGNSVDVTLNCATSAPGAFSGTLDCTTNDANNLNVSYNLSCTGQPLVVPTLSQWGLLAMALLMMFGGVVAFRVRKN